MLMSPLLHSSIRKGGTITATQREVKLREGKAGSFVQVVSKGSIRLNKDEINLLGLDGFVSRPGHVSPGTSIHIFFARD